MATATLGSASVAWLSIALGKDLENWPIHDMSIVVGLPIVLLYSGVITGAASLLGMGLHRLLGRFRVRRIAAIKAE